MSIIGTKWKCTDETLDQFGLVGIVIDAQTHPDYNGDGEIEVQHEDGSVAYMKVRRFFTKYEEVKG